MSNPAQGAVGAETMTAGQTLVLAPMADPRRDLNDSHGPNKVLVVVWAGVQHATATLARIHNLMVAKWRSPEDIIQQARSSYACGLGSVLYWSEGNILVPDYNDIAAVIKSIIESKVKPSAICANDCRQGLLGIEEAVSEIVARFADTRSLAIEEGARMVRERIAQSHLLMARKHQDAAADALQGSRRVFHEEDRKTWKKLQNRSLILVEYHSETARALLAASGSTEESKAVLGRPIITARGRDA